MTATNCSTNPPWMRQRAARLAPLAPLLQKRGLSLIELLPATSNCPLSRCIGTEKDGYWHWPERNLAGNAIDFCVQVLGC